MADRITLQTPTINVGKDEGQDINDLVMSLGGEPSKVEEHDINDLVMNAKPYVEPETATLKGEWWKRTKDIAKKIERYGELAVRGAAPSLASTTTGFALGGVPGAVAGTVALPAADLINLGINKAFGTHLGMPSEIAARYLAPGVKPPETESERVAQAIGSSVGGTASEISAAQKLAETAKSPVTRGVAKALSERPSLQLGMAAPVGGASQYVYDETGNPILSIGAGAAAGGLAGLRMTKRAAETVSADVLKETANTLFEKAKQSGVAFNKDSFSNASNGFAKELRPEGYTPNSYPLIRDALEEMHNPATPKDFTELSAIREMIKNAQASNVPAERRIASILKEKFDDYVSNIPKEDMQAGSKEGLEAWKDARDVWAKLKKGDMFDDIVRNSQYEKNPSNYIQNQIKNLAKNDKKMRTFTPEEQQAIRDLASGNASQKTLNILSSFAPTNALAGMFTLEALEKIPFVGKPLAYGSVAAKKFKEENAAQNVSNLAEMMRLGKKPQLESRLRDVPAQTVRGALSSQQQDEKKTKLTDLIPK